MSFLSYLINGISLGSIYAIIALGYTMVYGIARMLNFAHGDIIMVGGFVIFTCVSTMGFPPLVGVLVAVIACTVLGVMIERVAYKPLRGTSSLAVLITAIRCQLSASECGTSYFRIECASVYLRCKRSKPEAGWRCAVDFRCHDGDDSYLYHHHGRSDDLHQQDEDRSGNACGF